VHKSRAMFQFWSKDSMEEHEFYPNSDEEEIAQRQLELYKERCSKETTEWNYPPKIPNRPATEKQRCDTDQEMLSAWKSVRAVDSLHCLKQCPICGWWFMILRREHCTQFVHVLPCRTCVRKMKAKESERGLIADVEINTVPPNSPCPIVTGKPSS